MSLAARRSLRPARVAHRVIRAGTALRLLAVAVIIGWLIGGLLGLGRYINGYALYRGFPPPVTPHGIATGRTSVISFYSPALRQKSSAEVYLPPGYRQAAAAGQRFGVLYLLHGIPGVAANMFLAGAVGRDANILIGSHRIRPMIIVAPYGHSGRSNSSEWANGHYGAYQSYLLDVVHTIDSRYATVRDRAHRVLAGDSEGGYGAANVALREIKVFGSFQSWSGYFVEHPVGTFAGATAAVIDANSPLIYAPAISKQVRRLGLNAYLYQGAADRHGASAMFALADELRGAGAKVGAGLFPGGHDWGLWRAQMPHMLLLASQWMYGPHAGASAGAGGSASTNGGAA